MPPSPKDLDLQEALDLREALEPYWFRIEARHWSVADDNGDHAYSSSELIIRQIPIEKHTPKGAWLNEGICGRRLVRREYEHRGRAYAAPTPEQAEADFRKRKEYHIACLQGRINRAQRELALLTESKIRLVTYKNPF